MVVAARQQDPTLNGEEVIAKRMLAVYLADFVGVRMIILFVAGQVHSLGADQDLSIASDSNGSQMVLLEGQMVLLEGWMDVITVTEVDSQK